MSLININIRPSTGKTFQLEIDPEQTTVEQLKEKVAEKMEDVSAADLKLVFSGRILKNEDLCSDCKIKDGNTIHVVRSGKNRAPATSPNTTSATANTTNTNTTTTTNTNTNNNNTSDTNSQRNADPIPPIPPTPSPSTLPGLGNPFAALNSGNNGNNNNNNGFGGGFGGFGGFGGDMQMPNMDPEVMRQMMDSPFMQNLMGNTDFVRSIIMSNPQMKAMIEQNPELGHVISDPAFLRQSMEMMRNPELMREMQRNNDRALSNIEAIPGGFNHLRRMYNTVQGPLESALNSGTGNRASSDEANNNERLARQLNVESVPENSLNTQALPNPWAAPSNNNNNSSTSRQQSESSSNAAAGAGAFPFGAGAGAGGAGGANALSSLLGSGSFFPFGSQQQQQQQSNSNDQQSSNATTATGGNTQNATPFWADPNFIQASMRLHQAMMEGQANNNNNNNNNNNQQQQQQQANPFLQHMLSGFPMGGFGLPDYQQQQQQQPQQPIEPPEVRFRDQLAQLEEMGFSERQANVRALLATGGNVQAAIEYLFSSN